MKKKIAVTGKSKSTVGKEKAVAEVRNTQQSEMLLNFIVKGEVRAADGSTPSGVTVRAFDRDLRSEELLGEVITDKNGRYEITYTTAQFRRAEKKSADLVVRALGPMGTVLAASPVLFNARPVEEINLTLPATSSTRSEYEELLALLSPVMMKITPAELTKDDMDFLSGETGAPRERIGFLHLASQLGPRTKLPAEVFYGFARQGLPIDNEHRLLSYRIPALRRALEAAIAANIVPVKLKQELGAIMDRLRSLSVQQAFQPAQGEQIYTATLLGRSQLSREAQEQFVSIAADHEGTAEEFWSRLKNTPEFRQSPQNDEARIALQLGTLTGFHLPVVEAVQKMRANGKLSSLRDLTKLDDKEWGTLVQEAPKGLSRDAYIAALKEQVEAAFPTAAIAAQISRSNHPMRAELNAFFKAHLQFDLLTDSVESVGKEMRGPMLQEFKRIQRLARVAPRSQAFQALIDNGFRSAQQIATTSEGAFVTRYGKVFGGEAAARAVHQSAAQRTAMVQHLRMSFGREPDRVRPRPIPPAPTPAETPSNWTALFGSLDACACEHGLSVLGPAAYLTDLMQFIDKETDDGLDALLAQGRRPDLQDISLNAHNAETPMPYIDLVNEIFEQAVGLETDSLNRQTTWTAAELAANPEHVEAAAYDKNSSTENVAKAVFPWNLPFDLAATEGRVYLSHLGTSRHELIEAFYNGPEDLLQDEAIAREYLGLTEDKWDLISGSETFTLQKLWGLQPSDDPVAALSDPRQVLQRSNISLEELETLLSTAFINPSGKFKINYAACTLESASINFSDFPSDASDSLSRFCRFVRLQRLLGWSIAELDAALTIFFIAAPESAVKVKIPLLVFSHLQRVREQLALSVIDLLSFYTDLNNLPAPEGSPAGETLFDSVFFSRQIARSKEDDTTSKEFFDALGQGTKEIADYLPQVTAALGISAADVLLLLAMPSEGLSISSLSRLYRSVRFCRVVGLTFPEFIAINGLPGLHPVWSGSESVEQAPQSTLAFLTEAEYVRKSGFEIFELNGLLRGRMSEETVEASLRQNAAVLQQLRTGLQKIAADLRVPDDAAVPELERSFRQNLALLLEPDVVQKVVDWIQSDLSEPSPQQISFLGPLPPLPALPTEEAARDETLAKRYNILLNLLVPYICELQSRSLIKQQLGQALKLDPALSEKLLDEWVDAAGTPATERAVRVFLDPGFAAADEPTLAPEKYSDQQRIADQFQAVFQTLARLGKAALVISRLRLTCSEAAYLFAAQDNGQSKGWLDLATLPVEETDDASHAGWKRLVNACAFHRRLGSRIPTLFDLFDLAEQNRENLLFFPDTVVPAVDPAEHKFFGALLARTGWGKDDLVELLSGFGYDVPNFKDERAYLKLDTCFQLSRRLGVTIGNPWNMKQWAKETVDSVIAGSIKRAARARYTDDEAWAAVARPLQDQIREYKRAALVGFLAEIKQMTPDQLYGHFLIDPEMTACMLTSRIKQSISSVQLFIQRIFLGLEKGVAFTHKPAAAAKWTWMKNYRVWEANRKIFLWPENWIEPELRDDKTPFFKELENELRQNEITPDYVEKVYLNYLQKLDTVSNLEIVGQCYGRTKNEGLIEGGWPTLHVFGRTTSAPHMYFYRRRDSFGIWSAWEKVDVDIEGDHLLPVLWNGRLWLFWPVFKQAAGKPDTLPGDFLQELPEFLKTLPPTEVREFLKGWKEWVKDHHGRGQDSLSYWSVQLAAAQYSESGWTPRQVSKDSLAPWTNQEVLNSEQESFIPIYVHGRDDMPGLLASRFDDNSALFSFSYYKSNDQLEIDVRYPVLKVLSYPRTMRLTLPSNSGNSSVQQGDLFWSFPHNDLQLETAKVGAFQVRPNGIVIQQATKNEGRQLWSWLTARTKFSEQLDEGQPYSWETAYPMQGMGLHGFGDPYYQMPGPLEDYDLWIGAPDELFRITPPSEEPFRFWGLTCLLGLFVSDGQRTLFSELRNPRVFYHPFVTDCIGLVHSRGIDALLKPPPTSEFYRQRKVLRIIGSQEGQLIPMYPYMTWMCPLSYPGPDPEIWKPREDITFEDQEAYSIYNWELFFHIPLLIASRLSQNQQFEAAMRWFHYIFDPLDFNPSPEDAEWQRPWRLGRFYDNGDATRNIGWLMTILSGGTTGAGENPILDVAAAAQIRKSLEDQIRHWQVDPFKPHLLARMRITPYLKAVVMKYLDNLIAWADQLYGRDTIESINEATQYYILAAEILGPRPLLLPEQLHHDHTYAEIKQYLDDFSNALEEKIHAVQTMSLLNLGEKFVGINDLSALKPIIMQRLEGNTVESGAACPQTIAATDVSLLTDEARNAIGSLVMDIFKRGPAIHEPPPSIGLPAGHLYFCIPQNDTLLGYWDTVADRLFKIRHCLNIEGVERELPLFEPPIEPGLLVRAAAAGVDFSTVLNDLSAPAPHYRFNILSQKAAELCQEVKALGGALLAALEKRDAEGLALLRSEHEIALLEAVREVRKHQVREAQATLEGLQRARDVTETRYEYYKEIKRLIDQEQQYIGLTIAAMEAQIISQTLELGASTSHGLPDEYAGPIVGGMAYGGAFFHLPGSGSKAGAVLQGAARAAGMASTILSTSANLAATQAGHRRRWDDWKLQERLAQRELKQIDKQIAAAEIRVALAEQEFANHLQQIDNAREIADYMHSKFTNQELYEWMVGQISGVYFQSYQLAYDTAKRAERAYRFELGLDDSQFIRFGYWDNLRKGLLAGEQLYHDLKRMETDYLDRNRREYEMIKHISLMFLDPVALLSLRQNGECFIDLPEAIFDLDCPGHYMRRIKSVSLTIPCVAGPYTSVNCTLTLLSSTVRKKGTVTSKYSDDCNYTPSTVALQSIVTSSAQNDGGLFELNFRDERYLPFEGSGAISRWRIELSKEFRQFDYETISDVILHLKYTARDGGQILMDAAVKNLKVLVHTAEEESQTYGLRRAFSLKHEFPNAFCRLLNPPEEVQATEFELAQQHFPYFLDDKDLLIDKVTVYLKPKGKESIGTANLALNINSTDVRDWSPLTNTNLMEGKVDLSGNPIGKWTINAGRGGLDKNELDDILIFLRYKLKS